MAPVRRRARMHDWTTPAKVARQQTRKSCKCCGRTRQEDQTFSSSGLCGDCSTANLVAALMGMSHSEHWVEGPNGERQDWHMGPVINPT